MSSAAVLARLGFSGADRVVVLHADDVGMCEATISAYRDIHSRGILSSASAMVPCSWFPEVARLCRASVTHDMGVHLTLTSEWSGYRWGPVLGQGAFELCDAAGYFPPLAADVQQDRLRHSAGRELRAQLRRARSLGMDVTHVDSHMFTLMHRTLFPVYVDVAREFGVPCVILPHDVDTLIKELGSSEPAQLLVFDAWAELPLGTSSVDRNTRLETATRILDGLPAGLSYFISHPAVDCAELRAITPDWAARVADYHLYLDDGWARAIEASGVKVLGMRSIRQALYDDVHAAGPLFGFAES